MRRMACSAGPVRPKILYGSAIVFGNGGCCSDLNRPRWQSGACSSLYLPLSESLFLLSMSLVVGRCLSFLVFSQRGRERYACTLGVTNKCSTVHSMAHSYVRASARLTVNLGVISYIRQRRGRRLCGLLPRCWHIVSLVRLLSRGTSKTFTPTVGAPRDSREAYDTVLYSRGLLTSIS